MTTGTPQPAATDAPSPSAPPGPPHNRGDLPPGPGDSVSRHGDLPSSPGDLPAGPGDLPAGPRRRDAAGTRQLLLDAARRRFANDGYTATTVRHIADDAGVNVALINRYFTSKEGLFEACLVGAVDELGRTVAADVTIEQIPHRMAGQLAGSHTGKHPNQLLLLLRSSNDERAERIRLDTLRSFAERLASAAGWRPDHPDGDRLMLNAQITLSTAFGIALLRSSAAMEPLASASQQDLVGPLRNLIDALLAAPTRGPAHP